MANVTALDAKNRFGEILDRVSRGEEIVITRHDKPVARIVPEGRRTLQQVRQAVSGLRKLQSEIKLRAGGKRLAFAEVRAALEEGRR
jgi:prevent-host-death family protein